MTSPDDRTKSKVGADHPVEVLTALPEAMTGRASPAKAAALPRLREAMMDA